eukprot:1991488-Prymnesium_polylepis.1
MHGTEPNQLSATSTRPAPPAMKGATIRSVRATLRHGPLLPRRRFCSAHCSFFSMATFPSKTSNHRRMPQTPQHSVWSSNPFGVGFRR